LQKANLITLDASKGLHVSMQDIRSNPKKLQFLALDAAQLPRTLADVDLSVINTNYAVASGFLPSRDALAIEDKNSPYANIVVVREKDSKDPRFEKLMNALHSKEVTDKAEALFAGQAIPAW